MYSSGSVLARGSLYHRLLDVTMSSNDRVVSESLDAMAAFRLGFELA